MLSALVDMASEREGERRATLGHGHRLRPAQHELEP